MLKAAHTSPIQGVDNSLRRFFLVLTTLFWFRNKKHIFQLCTNISRLVGLNHINIPVLLFQSPHDQCLLQIISGLNNRELIIKLCITPTN